MILLWMLRLLVGVSTAEAASIRPLVDHPIITPELLPGDDGASINGPSLVRMPEGSNALGRYYLYFGHHHGQYIRLAYADQLAGPWVTYEPGVVPRAKVPDFRGHISSPDAVWVDDELLLYVHGALEKHAHDRLGKDAADVTSGWQRTTMLASKDGLTFGKASPILGSYYMRLFAVGDEWYAIAWGGQLLKAERGLDQPFTYGPVVTDELFRRPSFSGGGKRHDRRIRHVAIDREPSGTVRVYYTCTYDAPESLFRARFVTDGDWRSWHLVEPELLRPPLAAWEGADLPLTRSQNGPASRPENALRDPAVYREDGRLYVLWSVAGEQGIAIGEVVEE